MKDELFIYNLSGTLLGTVGLDPTNIDPVGVTTSPTDNATIWTVDGKNHLVFKYASATNKFSGTLSANGTFGLVSANGDPRGIADPVGNGSTSGSGTGGTGGTSTSGSSSGTGFGSTSSSSFTDYSSYYYGTSNDPGIQTNPAAMSFAKAIAADPSILSGASYVSTPQMGAPRAVASVPLTYFPRTGTTYGVLSTGNSPLVDRPGQLASEKLEGGHVRGNSDYNVTIVAVNVNVPSGDNYLSFDFQFLTEEYPVYVGSQFDDGFVAELDTTNWTTNNGAITAPYDFATTAAGKPLTVTTAQQYDLSPSHAVGTAFDGGLTLGTGGGDGAGTRLLRATTPVTAGAHTIYFSIFDQGDGLMDSAVLLDNLVAGYSATVKAGITEPLALSVMPDPTYNAGDTVVITGQASSSAGVAAVTVNGTEVQAIDAAGNWFDQVTILPGQNVFTIVATDNSGATTSSTLTLTGVQVDPTKPDYSILADATASILGQYHRTSFDAAPTTLYADINIHNNGQYEIDAPLLVGVIHISDPTVRVLDADGTTPSGIPYYDMSSLVTAGRLMPGQTTGKGTLVFANPLEHQFTYQLVVLGLLNQPPRFTTVPVVSIAAGAGYVYKSAGTDDDVP